MFLGHVERREGWKEEHARKAGCVAGLWQVGGRGDAEAEDMAQVSGCGGGDSSDSTTGTLYARRGMRQPSPLPFRPNKVGHAKRRSPGVEMRTQDR